MELLKFWLASVTNLFQVLFLFHCNTNSICYIYYMIKTIFISERYFTKEELDSFRINHGYEIKEISYSSSEGEIDFNVKDQKKFLLKEGYPKILARFFS